VRDREMIETLHHGQTSRLKCNATAAPAGVAGPLSPWLTVKEAAERARCGIKTIYREVKANRLKAAKVGGRRELRIRPEWIDAWLESSVS